MRMWANLFFTMFKTNPVVHTQDRKLFTLLLGRLLTDRANSIAAAQSISGGARRDRTDDLKLAKLPLSQLSYGP